MERVSVEEIFYGIAQRAGILEAEIDTDTFRAMRRSVSRRLREGWRRAMWPDLVEHEKRYFRRVWQSADAPYAAATEVFHQRSEEYYQALKSTSAEPADSDGVVSDHWAVCEVEYYANDYDATLTYVVGDQVYYPDTGAFYQMHTAAAAGTAPTNTAAWGVLTEFLRYVAQEQVLAGGEEAQAIGDVLGVTKKDPRVHRAPLPLAWTKTEAGVWVFEKVPHVWIEHRRRAPELRGDTFEVGTAYAVGQQVYYEGDFYECVEATSAGQTPESHAAKWELIEIPIFLERWLVQAGYADSLESEGQKEKAAAEMGEAYAALSEEMMVLGGQEGLGTRTVVGVR